MKLLKFINKKREERKIKRINDEILKSFESIKSKTCTITSKKIEGEMEVLEEQKPKAEKLKQVRLLESIEQLKNMKSRELLAIEKGINKVISFEDIKDLNQVGNRILALSDLEDYPRDIPKINAEKIAEANKVFDKVVILYTDYTNETNQIEIEKDPIAFGLFFKDEKARFAEAFDRAYFITDWIDDYCDLTFEKLVTELQLKKD